MIETEHRLREILEQIAKMAVAAANSGEQPVKPAEPPDALRPEQREREEPLPPTMTSVPDTSEIRISVWVYLRTIFLMAWSAFRHPFRTTYIDMASGEVVHIPSGEEAWE